MLACGEGAAVSHRTAARLHGLRPDNRARIDVSSPGRRGRAVAGIDAHRADTLRPRDVQIVEGIRCTTVARTLLDLAEIVGRQLERACEQAEVLQRFDLRASRTCSTMPLPAGAGPCCCAWCSPTSPTKVAQTVRALLGS